MLRENDIKDLRKRRGTEGVGQDPPANRTPFDGDEATKGTSSRIIMNS